MLSEYNLSDKQIEVLRANIDDLEAQADFYDMDVDYETVGLTPHQAHTRPAWYDRWIETRRTADLDELIDMERE